MPASPPKSADAGDTPVVKPRPGRPPKQSMQPFTEVKSAARTIELLETLASEPHPLTLSEIATKLDLPVSSTHQLLRTLEAKGWLELTPFGGGYTLGIRALLTGMALIERDPVVRAVRPIVAMLRAELQETIHLARLDGARVVYLLSRESQHQLRTVSRVGQSLPAYAAGLGLAALAKLTDEEVIARMPAKLEPLTPHTITTIDELLEELRITRERGWAEEREQNTILTGCIAVSIPIRNSEYAISCSMPLSRLTDQRRLEIAESLLAAAESVGDDLDPWERA